MKRTDALQQLSRDHHRALAVALKLRRATDADAATVREQFMEFWRTHGELHFRVEEKVLLPGVARAVEPTDPAVVRVLTDHIEIRRRADDLGGDQAPGTDALHALGELLNDHVRHEERVLFPMIEVALSAAELSDLARRIEDAERSG